MKNDADELNQEGNLAQSEAVQEPPESVVEALQVQRNQKDIDV